MPAGARAPGEVRPEPGPYPQPATLAALEQAAALEVAIAQHWDRSGAVVTHHLFGRLSMPQAIRFVTVHTEHHAGQLPR